MVQLGGGGGSAVCSFFAGINKNSSYNDSCDYNTMKSRRNEVAVTFVSCFYRALIRFLRKHEVRSEYLRPAREVVSMRC